MTSTPQAAPAAPPNIEDMIARYVKMRDAIKLADADHKDKLAPARDFLEQLENQLLALMNASKTDSLKTKAGTAYITKRTSATIKDADAFRKFIVQNEAFDMVDWRANPTATAAFVEQTKAPPPGVNYSVALTVGVRRA